ncbi:MAG: Re/Si-specific NAD(P)(+) transhydrogenase subunit alpha [Legionellales bacterium]|nr:Re/Si-specific NAD(P)(+) transhydrogenase subunit alpha [Legionellales bacterium]
MIRIAIPKESLAGEKRVALTPNLITHYQTLSAQLTLEHDAGALAHYPNRLYHDIAIAKNLKDTASDATIILKVRAPSAKELACYPDHSILIGMLSPHNNHELELYCKKNITSFALELLPRITRAQSMDVLSSQASCAGYFSALLAAQHLPRFFPMLTTAAGTIKPAQILVIGAGVAGLQAIATVKRLGAMVEAYDIRPEAREQVESLGAKMVKLNINATSQGGYARELTPEEQQLQRDILTQHVAKAECVITTASVPGRLAPKIITKDMVEHMQPGSVIIDIAAEQGGNCELTQCDNIITHHDVLIVGATHLPSYLAKDASHLYARNLFNFLQLICHDGKIIINREDEILNSCLLTHQGEITYTKNSPHLQGVST